MWTRLPKNAGPRRQKRTGPARKARTPVISEIDLHRSVAELLDWCLLPPAVYTTFPAGWGKLPPKTVGRLKACGLKTGMPDILVFNAGKTIGIELKRPGGRLSKAQ